MIIFLSTLILGVWGIYSSSSWYQSKSFYISLLGKGNASFLTHEGGVEVILAGGVATISVDLSSLDSSELWKTPGGAEDEDVGDLDVSFKLSPTWLSTSHPHHKVIIVLTLLKLSGTEPEEVPPLRLVLGWSENVSFSLLSIEN